MYGCTYLPLPAPGRSSPGDRARCGLIARLSIALLTANVLAHLPDVPTEVIDGLPPRPSAHEPGSADDVG